MRVTTVLLAVAMSVALVACSSGGGDADPEAVAEAVAAQLEASAPEGTPWEVTCDDIEGEVEAGDVLGCEATDGVGDLWTIDVTVEDDEGNVTVDAERQ